MTLRRQLLALALLSSAAFGASDVGGVSEVSAGALR